MSLALEDQYDRIYRYCYFRVRNVQLAEDLTQETFVRFFSQSSYINRGKPLAYLYTIAKNLCVDAYKKASPQPLDGTMMSEDCFGAFETNFVMRQAVAALPQDLQELLLFRFGNDLGVTEISRITNLSRFAVHRKLGRAIKQLKLILKEEDFS